jgi:adenylate cyclase
MSTNDKSAGLAHRFIAELKRRRVIRVATLYVVAFWPIIQIVDILSPALGFPDSIMRYLIIAFSGGFPIVLILAWIFDINKGGVIAVTDDSTSEAPALIGSRTELIIIGLLCAVVAGLFYVQSANNVDSASTETQTLRSVAVLPFVSFSSNQDDQFFADGLTEELLNVLSRVKSLRVAARTSSFAYRGVNKNVQEIGRELNVGVIVEGSVRRNDVNDTVRITAQLINVSTGDHIWSQSYDREFTDLFSIQDDIASSVVAEMQVTLLGDEADVLKTRESASPEAIVAFGMGQSELAKRSRVSLADATRFFRRSIEIDPNYVAAHAALADALSLQVSYGYTDQPIVNMSLAQESVDVALQLDPRSGIAWASQGLIQMEKMDKQGALTSFENSMEYNPSYAIAMMWYASLMESVDEKLNWYQQAYELDPKSPVIGFNLASVLMSQGRETEAMQVFDQIVEADPYYANAYVIAAKISEKRGRLEDAVSYYSQAYDLNPDQFHAAAIARVHIDLGQFQIAESWIEQIEPNANVGDIVVELRLHSLAAQNKIKEAMPLLQQQIAGGLASDAQLSDQYDGIHAAYFASDWQSAISIWEKSASFEAPQEHRGQFFDAGLASAFAYLQLGNINASQQVTKRIKGLIEELLASRMADAELFYQRALIAAIEKDDQQVLINTQRAIDEGWRQHWRPEVEPILNAVRHQPNFTAMMAGLQARMDIMREQAEFASFFDS